MLLHIPMHHMVFEHGLMLNVYLRNPVLLKQEECLKKTHFEQRSFHIRIMRPLLPMPSLRGNKTFQMFEKFS